MPNRSSRYEDISVEKPTIKSTRMGRNQHLYDEINNRIGYEDFSSLDTQTKIDLSSITGNNTTREKYQQIKDYKDFVTIDEKVDVVTTIEPVKEIKVFDINSILEEARKNRTEKDELERKRKPKDDDFSELEKIKNEDVRIGNGFDENELTDLINTITSHELATEIKSAEENGLLDELLATNVDMRVQDGIAEEALEESKKIKLDSSFYTKSMDLSEQDFELSEEIEAERQKHRKILIVIISIILFVGIAILAFLGLKKMGIF